MKRRIANRWASFPVGIIFVATLVSSVAAGPVDDAYIAGYAAAVLEREFRVNAPSLRVQDGVISLHVHDIRGADEDQVVAALARVPGVQGVAIQTDQHQQAALVNADASHQSQRTQAQTPPSSEKESTLSEGEFLPTGLLFQPLLADPRWPNFSAIYRYYIGDRELSHVGAANFGGTIALYRNRAPLNAQWEFGLQAGVFSIFNLQSVSKDLINSDFFVSSFTSYRKNDFSGMVRLFHQSSHLGDEFLLHNRVNRINLSYESIDLKLSYQFFDMLRLYTGGGWLFDQEPADLDPWMTQFGMDFESPWLLPNNAQPVLAADFKLHEEHAWSTDFSLRAGLRFGGSQAAWRKLALMFEYFKGHSPNGQFYQRKIEYVGLGVHYYF